MAELAMAAAIAGRGLEVALRVAAGEVLAVLGANGAGKSTTAAIIAGLLSADQAMVRVGNRTLTDTARGISIPIHNRRVGMLLQEPLLFPHMSAVGNVVFAARRQPDPRLGARRWLERVGAEKLAERKPAELSGGEAQRVALARALAAEPDVLLLDEPLAGLDVAAAASMRAVLRQVLTGTSRATVLITHDLLDVLALADRVVVLEAGRIAEIGLVAEVLAAPRSRFGARIAGVNLVRGILVGPGVLSDPTGQNWHGIMADPLPAGQDAVAVFSPASVAVFRDRPHGSPRNSVGVRVAGLEVNGGAVRVRAAEQVGGTPGLAADVTPEAVADLRVTVGDQVWFSVKTQEVSLHAASRSAAPQL